MVHLSSFERCYGKMLPKLGTVRRNTDPLIYCKFIDYNTTEQWLVLEGEKRDDTYLFYGFVVGTTVRMQEFTLAQLESKRTVSLALFFKPAPLSYIKLPLIAAKTKYHSI